MNLQPTLENDLVRIRPMTIEDKEPLFEIAKDPLIWQQHHVKRYQRNVFENFFVESMESGGALVIIDKSSNEFMGSSRYQLVEGFPEGVEIGWTFISRKYWGGKYNAEVKHLMIDHAFEHVSHALLYINKNNIRSQKAAGKIGGRRLTPNEWMDIPRKNEDTLIYMISK